MAEADCTPGPTPVASIPCRGAPGALLTAHLELPLQCGCERDRGHCAPKSGLFDSEYFHVFADMTRRYANLYGDTSAFNVPIPGGHAARVVSSAMLVSECCTEALPRAGAWSLAWMKAM